LTKDERFFRIGCLFRPWPERGEIVALTGHLAENELHGGLSFIERALGVEKVRELYEQEDGKSLSQSELARRLKADGYPVPQPHISRMQEAIQFLLPAIPSALYAGLGRPQVEQLTYLRRAGSRIWDARVTTNSLSIDFATLFQDVLMVFDSPGSFTAQRVQDELIGQMSELLGVDYDTLVFEITDSEKRWQLLTSEPNTPPGTETTGSVSTTKPTSPSVVAPPTSSSTPRVSETPRIPASDTLSIQEGPATHPPADVNDDQYAKDDHSALLQEHIVSPAETTERLQSIQRLVTDHVGETPPDSKPACYRPSLFRQAVSTPSRMSGTSIPASIRRIGYASTSLSSRVRSPTKRVWKRPLSSATRASASHAREYLPMRTRTQISVVHYCCCIA